MSAPSAELTSRFRQPFASDTPWPNLSFQGVTSLALLVKCRIVIGLRKGYVFWRNDTTIASGIHYVLTHWWNFPSYFWADMPALTRSSSAPPWYVWILGHQSTRRGNWTIHYVYRNWFHWLHYSMEILSFLFSASSSCAQSESSVLRWLQFA